MLKIQTTKALFQLNELVNYQYPTPLIEDMAASVNELTPELLPDKIKKIIDRMKIGKYSFDAKLGIQNIYNGYRLLLQEEGKALMQELNTIYDNRREPEVTEDKTKAMVADVRERGAQLNSYIENIGGQPFALLK